MKAYKFRGSHQFDMVMDIVLGKRLYCADWAKLNDPMEGVFAYSHNNVTERDIKQDVEKIINEKKKIRVCSLASTFESHLMWAHYASGFEGFAIEVELPDNDSKIKKVEYRGIFAGISLGEEIEANQVADEILSSKYNEWEYEKEIMILSQDEYYYLENPITRIIVGHRMKPALFKAVEIICRNQNITLCRIGIGDMGMDADLIWKAD